MWTAFIEWIARLFGQTDDGRMPPGDGIPDWTDPEMVTEPIEVSVEDIPPPSETPTLGPVPTVGSSPSPSIRVVSAWCGSASLANPERDVAFAHAIGLNRLDLVVNDHSGWRKSSRFTVRNTDRIRRLVDLAQDRGIEVHFMSWIMPHADYIKGAADALIPLAESCNVKGIQWDAEEPWMRAERAMDYEAAAELLKDRFAIYRGAMGVNGIGYAPAEKFKPLAAVCDYVVPQCYVTRRNQGDPTKVPGKFYRRYKKHFDKPVVMGLAAYLQSGIRDYSPSGAITAAVQATRRLEGVDTIIYWSLRHIRGSKEVADAISRIRKDQSSSSSTASESLSPG